MFGAQNLMNGDPCDDLNYRTTGEQCNNGSSTGGSPVTTCVDGDNCCPSNCTAQNDLECNYPFGTARMVNGNLVNVQYHPCGNGNPGQCTAAAAQQTCQALGLKVVSHASDGTSTVFSLGATVSCNWSISYYTVNKQMPTNSCLVGISNLMWSSCCLQSSWHGNTVAFGAPNATFGYVASGNSGYVSTNPNVSGATQPITFSNQATASSMSGTVIPTWSIPTSPSWPFALPGAPEPGLAGGAADAVRTAVTAATATTAAARACSSAQVVASANRAS